MADPYWDAFYRSLGIGAPLDVQPQMSVEDIYRGIIPSQGPTTRQVKAVPIDPTTGLPTSLAGAVAGDRLPPSTPVLTDPVQRFAPDQVAGMGTDIEGNRTAFMPPMPRPRPNAALAAISGDPGDGGLFGIPMSPSIPPQQPPSGPYRAPAMIRREPKTATQEQPRRGFSLLDMISGKGLGNGLIGTMFGGDGSRPSIFSDIAGGLGSMMQPQPRAPITVTPQQAAMQNPLALAALNENRTSYAGPGGNLIPTVAMNGLVRNSYGDSSSYGSGGSLI